MQCKLRIGEWVVTAEVDDPDSPVWTATVLDAGDHLAPGEFSVAWIGPNGEPGRPAHAAVEQVGAGGGVVLRGQGPLS